MTPKPKKPPGKSPNKPQSIGPCDKQQCCACLAHTQTPGQEVHQPGWTHYICNNCFWSLPQLPPPTGWKCSNQNLALRVDVPETEPTILSQPGSLCHSAYTHEQTATSFAAHSMGVGCYGGSGLSAPTGPVHDLPSAIGSTESLPTSSNE